MSPLLERICRARVQKYGKRAPCITLVLKPGEAAVVRAALAVGEAILEREAVANSYLEHRKGSARASAVRVTARRADDAVKRYRAAVLALGLEL